MITCHLQTGNSATVSGSLKSDLPSILAAVRLLTKDTRHREMRCLERRCDARLPFQRPVEVTPLSEDEAALDPSVSETITAYTRDISVSGVGLLHDQPFPSKRVRLTFELLGGDTLSLVALLTWCRYFGDFWYSSGGRLIGVVPPVCRDSLEEWEDDELFQ